MRPLTPQARPSAARRRTLLHTAVAGGLTLLLAPHSPRAQPAAAAFLLITEEESAREAQAAASASAPPPRSRGMPQPPAIEVIAPSDAAVLTSPVRLEAIFRAAADARILPDSFRVLYGVLKIDLTERLQRHARLSESGVVVEAAQVPQGTHRLLVRVADDKGRVAEQAIVFRVTRRP
ncbi:MAG: hypothetical protein Q8K45_18415 [Rubrivivax sp.]|nr:hypothetical protein [Rubrivivax sp.]